MRKLIVAISFLDGFSRVRGATSWSCRWTLSSTHTTRSGSSPPTHCCSDAGRSTCFGASGQAWPTTPKHAHREFAKLENAIDKVVVSDTMTADDTEPWRTTTRIVRRVGPTTRSPS